MTFRKGLHQTEKICSVHKGKPLPISEFTVNSRGDGYRGECNKCRNRLRRERRWGNGKPEDYKNAQKRYRNSAKGRLTHRARILQKKYGLTLDQFDEIMRRQQGRCKICKIYFSKSVRVHIDHNHKTGVVRGFLCKNCNIAIGLLRENLSSLRRAVRYLRKGKALLDSPEPQ